MDVGQHAAGCICAVLLYTICMLLFVDIAESSHCSSLMQQIPSADQSLRNPWVQLGQYGAACTEVFPLCNKALCEAGSFDCSMSGSTGILAILQNNKQASLVACIACLSIALSLRDTLAAN